MWVRSGKFLVISSVVIILATRCFAEEALRRQRRMLAYPINSCTGVLVALAIPLGLEHRSVFMSYNFEANYNMPTTAPELIPGPLTRLDLVEKDRSFKSSHYNRTDDRMETTAAPPANFISREKIYKLIESKISGLNLNGKKCLLRLICEAAEAHESLFKHNGVLGDLLNILLTPSSTRAEGSPKYHNAELAGRKGDCESYREGCVVNFLDYFTSVL